MSSATSLRRPALIGVACVFVVFSWWFLTVRYNYGGDWSGLFCTGSQAGIPPVVAGEHPYEFPGIGWDGQWYHAIAHDPLLRRGTASYLDNARLRYRRILVPALASLLASGNDAFVDTAYRAVIVVCIGLGGFWLVRLAEVCGKPAFVGMAFFALPASVAAIDRQAVDVGLLCLCCAFVLYTRYVKNPAALYLVLVAAGLVRETGLLLTLAYCARLLIGGEMRKCGIYATATVAPAAWYLFVNTRTQPSRGDGAIALPFSGVLSRVLHPGHYRPGGLVERLIQSADLLAMAGVSLAIGWALLLVWRSVRRRPDPVDLAILLFALLGMFVWRPGDSVEALDYGRILSPLLLFEALVWLEGGSPWPALAPLGLVLPRFGIEMGHQVLGVLQGLRADI